MDSTFIISKIAVEGKRKKLFAIYSGDALLCEINEDTLVHFALHKGKSLTAPEIRHIRHYNDLFDCRAQALRYLARRAHLSAELKNKLRQKGYSNPLIEETLQLLDQNGLLDDPAFIRMYIREKIKLAHSGPLLIKKKLMEKGALPVQAEEHIQQLYPEEKQLGEALSLLKKKAPALCRIPDKKRKEKLRRTLQGKGFFGNVIQQAMVLYNEENHDTGR